MNKKVVFYLIVTLTFQNHHWQKLGRLTLSSSTITVIELARLLLVILSWLPVLDIVLCTHWERSPAPWDPCDPAGPWAPCEPLYPWGPMMPWGPCVPLNPGGPAGPVCPWEPLKPGSPIGPIGPWSFLTLSTCKRDGYNMSWNWSAVNNTSGFTCFQVVR